MHTGYLQENCKDAAKLFLENCPLLQECRLVIQKGQRYSTKVGGFTLVDILDRYCSTYDIGRLTQTKLITFNTFHHSFSFLQFKKN